jgi:hypothetical protein
MIRFRVETAHGDVEVSINVDDGHELGPLIYDGPEDAVTVTRGILSVACGAHGHLIGEKTTPVDLHAALMQLPKLLPELLEGQELVQSYDVDLPEGSVT